MASLHSVSSTPLRSALPTVNHTRTILQKQRSAAERSMPPAAVVSLSPQATRTSQTDPQARPAAPPESAAREDWDTAEAQNTAEAENAPAESVPSEPTKTEGQASIDGLTADQREMVTELVQRDRVVRAHEAAHQAAGGGLVGAASYSYQEGPDGRSYAIGGEVPIQMPASDNPQEMISIAQRVRAAALAPANPSGQDMAVANAAVQMEAQARQALAQQTAQQQEQAAAPAGQAPAQKQASSREGPGQAAAHSSQTLTEKQALPRDGPGQAAAPEHGTAHRAMAAYAKTRNEAPTV